MLALILNLTYIHVYCHCLYLTVLYLVVSSRGKVEISKNQGGGGLDFKKLDGGDAPHPLPKKHPSLTYISQLGHRLVLLGGTQRSS